MKIGLTVGKFAPFHKGHQLLIETALSEVDLLLVIIYSAQNCTQIPIQTRAQWIKTLYPSVLVIEANDVPKDEGYTEEIQQKHVHYILSLIKDYKINAFYSSEAYGDKMSQALNCENRIVDLERRTINISGTDIRKRQMDYETFLDPLVYDDLIKHDFYKC